MFQLIQIGVQMLHADLVVSADDAALQEAPNALDPVSVNVAAHPFLCAVVHALVPRVFIGNSEVSGKLIRIDRFRVWRGVVRDELVERGLGSVLNDLQPNLAVPLQGSDGDGLAPFVAVAHAASLSADIGLIHFHDTPQKLRIGFPHGRTDAMAQVPRGLIGDVQGAFDLQGANSFLAFGHQVNRNEPLNERKVGVVKDRAGRGRKLIAAGVALVLIALREYGDAFASAARAIHTFRPAKLSQANAALFFGAEKLNELHQIDLSLECGFGRSFHFYA